MYVYMYKVVDNFMFAELFFCIYKWVPEVCPEGNLPMACHLLSLQSITFEISLPYPNIHSMFLKILQPPLSGLHYL